MASPKKRPPKTEVELPAQIVKHLIYPKGNKGIFIARLIHPTTKAILWEQKYPENTPQNAIWNEINQYYHTIKAEV